MTKTAGHLWAQRTQRVLQQGPHTRIYVTKRSWLDAGVEVLPGDRKFTDYAFPPDGYPDFARENNNRPIDRQPINPPSDMGGYDPTARSRCIERRKCRVAQSRWRLARHNAVALEGRTTIR